MSTKLIFIFNPNFGALFKQLSLAFNSQNSKIKVGDFSLIKPHCLKIILGIYDGFKQGNADFDPLKHSNYIKLA